MLKSLSHIYFKTVLRLFVSLIGRKDQISNIIVMGSVASGKAKLLFSDIDITIILHDESESEVFLEYYKKFLQKFSILCPFILPINERISNVYSKKSLAHHSPSMINGYLSNQDFKIIYGEMMKPKSCEISDLFYFADKIKVIIKSSKNTSKKRSTLVGLSSQFSFNNMHELNSIEKLEYKKIVPLDQNQFLKVPITTDIKNHVFQYENLESLITETKIFYQKHPFIHSIHYSSPWYIFIDHEVKVIHEQFFKEASHSKDNKVHTAIQEIDRNILSTYLKDFCNYKQSKKNDFLNKTNLSLMSNYFQQILENKKEYKTYDLYESIEIINNKKCLTLHEISLCICTKDRKESLIELFESIKKQTYFPKQIVIINNGNSWEPEYLASLKAGLESIEVNIYESSLGTISALRNFAIEKASYEIISFVDDDCSLPANWLQIVSHHFNADKELTILGGTVLHERQENLGLTESFHRQYLEERSLC